MSTQYYIAQIKYVELMNESPVGEMIEEPKTVLEELSSDQNFLMILAGAIIWYLGYYVEMLSGLFAATGFVLVVFYTANLSLRRPVSQAWPGLLLGGLMQLLGYYSSLLHILFLPPALIVAGGVTIVYFAFPLALQRGELPVITRLQKLIESKMQERKKEGSEAKESEKDDAPATGEE
jgi:hypothetical protein